MIDISAVRAIAVQNYLSSGTTLLHSLFDGHPQLLCLPGLYGIQYYRQWHVFAGKTPNEMLHLFLMLYRGLFEPEYADPSWGLQTLGESGTESPVVSKSDFVAHFASYFNASASCNNLRRRFLISIYVAYEAALGRDLSHKQAIVFPIHSNQKIYARQFIEDFPDARFVHMVRHPVALYGSGLRHMAHNHVDDHHPLCHAVITQLFLNKNISYQLDDICGDRPYFPELADNTTAIRLEDLHATPEKTLRSLCSWLGITWHDTLMSSTFGGKKWWNRPESVRLSGFGNAVILQDYSQFANGFDKLRLNLLADHYLATWRYPRLPALYRWLLKPLLPVLILVPFRVEFRIPYLRLISLLGSKVPEIRETVQQYIQLERARRLILDQIRAHKAKQQITVSWTACARLNADGKVDFTLAPSTTVSSRDRVFICSATGIIYQDSVHAWRSLPWFRRSLLLLAVWLQDYVATRKVLFSAWVMRRFDLVRLLA